MTNPDQLPPTTHLAEAHLQVADLERSLAFYQDLLGFLPVNQPDAGQLPSTQPRSIALSPSGQPPVVLRLTERPGAKPRPRHTTGLYHIAIRLPDRQALGLLFKRLTEHSWPISGAADHLVSEALYLNDPDGLGLELYIDRPRADWNWQDGLVSMETDPLNINSLLQAAAGARWTGLPAATDLGHVHLHVADLETAEAFYSRLLSFTVTQRNYPGALFMSAGGYHHHIAVNTWAGVGAPPPPTNASGLLWFSVAVPGRPAYESLRQRLQTAGLLLEGSTQPGSQEAEPAFYAVDPAGNRVELRLVE